MDAVQMIILGLSAVAIGLNKTGLTGVGALAVIGFALVFPARESTGAILPLLIAGDLITVVVYRHDASWRLIGRLTPWVPSGSPLASGIWPSPTTR